VAGFFGWQYKVAVVHPLVERLNAALSPYTLPWLQRTFGHVNPTLALLVNLAVVTSILFILSMTMIPALERLFIRTRLVNPIWRVELDLRRVEGARE
jgi:hypothetical protein